MFSIKATNDRAYLVKIDGRFKELKMAAVMVDALRRFNDGDNRKNFARDKAFVKTLIIGLCGLKSIEDGESVHQDLIIFIRGSNVPNLHTLFVFYIVFFFFSIFVTELFVIRLVDVDIDGVRYLSFRKLFDDACNEIRKRIF